MAEYKYIDCEIYRMRVVVFLGSYEELVKWVKKEFTNPHYKHFVNGFEDFTPGEADTHSHLSTSIIRLNKYPKTPQELATCSHEVLHAVFYILDYSGVRYLCEDDKEAFTYLDEWLFNKLLDKEGYIKVNSKEDGKEHGV